MGDHRPLVNRRSLASVPVGLQESLGTLGISCNGLLLGKVHTRQPCTRLRHPCVAAVCRLVADTPRTLGWTLRRHRSWQRTRRQDELLQLKMGSTTQGRRRKPHLVPNLSTDQVAGRCLGFEKSRQRLPCPHGAEFAPGDGAQREGESARASAWMLLFRESVGYTIAGTGIKRVSANRPKAEDRSQIATNLGWDTQYPGCTGDHARASAPR